MRCSQVIKILNDYAVIHNMELYTLNLKDFRFMEKVEMFEK
jgi:hypothetical protein